MHPSAEEEEEKMPADMESDGQNADENIHDIMGVQEEQDDLGDWYPACITKATARLCIHDQCDEVMR